MVKPTEDSRFFYSSPGSLWRIRGVNSLRGPRRSQITLYLVFGGRYKRDLPSKELVVNDDLADVWYSIFDASSAVLYSMLKAKRFIQLTHRLLIR